MCDITEGANDVQDTHWPRARKPHTCCACNETIPIGHRYARTCVVWEGTAESFKHCARCWMMLEALWRVVDPDTYVAWELNCGENWSNVFGDLPDEVAALAFLTPQEAQQLRAVRCDGFANV